MNTENIDSTMVEVKLFKPSMFLPLVETLERIGVKSKTKPILYQTCHVLHSDGTYYIVHFKELFVIEGRDNMMTVEDYDRRNKIIKLLSGGEKPLITIPELQRHKIDCTKNVYVDVISREEKDHYECKPKYKISRLIA